MHAIRRAALELRVSNATSFNALIRQKPKPISLPKSMPTPIPIPTAMLPPSNLPGIIRGSQLRGTLIIPHTAKATKAFFSSTSLSATAANASCHPSSIASKLLDENEEPEEEASASSNPSSIAAKLFEANTKAEVIALLKELVDTEQLNAAHMEDINARYDKLLTSSGENLAALGEMRALQEDIMESQMKIRRSLNIIMTMLAVLLGDIAHELYKIYA